MPIRILIVDDHMVVRKGIRTMLEPKPDMEFVGEALDGEQAVDLASALKPDVILMDLIMPRKGGIEAIKEITRQNPEAKILVLTSFSELDKVIAAVKAGARGYVLKDSSPQDLVQAIRDVWRGEMWLWPGLAEQAMLRLQGAEVDEGPSEPLTEREVDVLRLIAQGLSNQEIAARLYLVEGTVRFHVNHILAKLRLANRTQAALYALREGLVTLY